ncbi:LamG-like jellyroll fold domain-containing protein, partial [Flavobacterium sp.]|uniref:LamG domain-containing protein n=1 Tax=Flavobacterium sp. TaxID=239 RepID=UPI0037C0EF3E
PGRCPKTWKIYATNDDRCWNATGGKNRTPSYNVTSEFNWIEIDYKSNQYSYVDNTLFDISNNNTGYRFYAINVNALRGSTDATGGYLLHLYEMFIYGYVYIPYQNRLGSPNNKGNIFLNDFRVHTNTSTAQFEDNLYDVYNIQNTSNIYSLNQNQIITLTREELNLNTLQYNAYSNLTISSWIRTDNFANNDVILEISNDFYNDITNLYFWYKFDTTQFLKNHGIAGSTYDLIPSTGNTLTCQTIDRAYGDASVNFTSTGGYFYVPQYNFATNFTTACSISFWLKKKGINSGSDVCLIGWLNGVVNAAFRIQKLYLNTCWRYSLFGSSDTNTNTILNDWTADNLWNHYVWIAEKATSSTKITLYKNGVYVFSATSGTWTPANVGFAMSYNTSTDSLIGNLDDFRVYNKAITLDEILNLYENSIIHAIYTSTSNMITWYKFDENATDILLDSSGKFNHLTNNSATFDSASYKLGNGAIYFNGSSYVEFPSTVNPSTIWSTGTGITFAFWFKMSTSTGSYGRIMDFADNPLNTNATNQIIITKNSTLNTISFIINDQTYTTTTNYVDNNWHYIVWSISSSGIWTIYIDNLNLSVNITKTIPTGIIWQRRFLGRPWTSWDSWMIGNLDDFRIYNKVLIPNEVSILYALYSSSRDLTTNLIALYKFDSNLTTDSSQNNTLTNYSVQNNISDYVLGSSSAQFNGSSYFQISNDGRFSPDIFTVCCWCKIVQGSDYQSIVSCRNGQSSGWNIYVNASQNLEFWCMNGNWNGLGTSLYNTFASNPAVWRHLAISFVKSPNEVKVYVDNVLLTTTTRAYTNNTGTSLRIGAGANETTPMFYLQNGSLLDDFRFYNRVLSATEISAIYNLRNTKIMRSNFSLKKTNNLLSFQINNASVCDIPYLDNKWNHILWNINNNFQNQGFIKINNGSKNFYTNQQYSIFEYPPASLNSASGTTTNKSLTLSATHTDGLYIVSSSTINDLGPEKAFNKIPINNAATDNDRWISAATYNASGVYTGAVSTTYTVNNTTISYTGEWIQIQLPTGIVVTSYSLSTEYVLPSRGPKDFVVLGSINGSAWNLVNMQTGISSYSGNIAKQFIVYSVNAYSYYRLCINTTNTGTSAGIGEWRLFGYPTLAQNFKLGSVNNIGDLNLYDFKIITNQLTAQTENDLFNYYIPESFDYIKYNNIQIYSDKIKFNNTSVTSTTSYLNYKFQNNQFLTTDNSSNARHLNISNISCINDQNKNSIIIRPNTEATFANDNWLSYTDLSVSGWFKNTRTNDGDDIILEMTTNQISKNNFFNDITNLYFWYKLDSIDFCKNFGLTGKTYDLIGSSANTIYPQKTDKTTGDASANFTASGGYLYVPQYNFATNFSGAITIAFWLKRKGLQSSFDVVFYGFTNSATSSTIIIQRNSTATNWTYTLFGATGNTSATLNDYTNDNVWNHY